MRRYLFCTLLSVFLLLRATTGQCATFDERLWEKYAEIKVSQASTRDSLAGFYLEPYQLGDVTANPAFADLRVVTGSKEEVPWQIVSRMPEQRKEELPVRMENLSRTETGETWLELVIEKEHGGVNAVDVVTTDTEFSRQVQVLGSLDGKNWNTLRSDGVIFDSNRGEKLRHTRITFPESTFRHLALKIANGAAPPLSISAVRVFRNSDSQGQSYTIHGKSQKPEINASRKESSIAVRMDPVFPVDRLVVATTEGNFQRAVEIQIKRGTGGWEHWAQGTVFSFDTPTMHESQLTLDMPEVAAREFRLVFKDLDSPPLSITGVNGEGYRKLLVFKQQGDRKLYLFWGNPRARQPRYDLAEVITRQKLDELPMAYLGESRPNSKFAGNNARLPFSERYKYPLYALVTLAIAGLVLLQYRVFKRVER